MNTMGVCVLGWNSCHSPCGSTISQVKPGFTIWKRSSEILNIQTIWERRKVKGTPAVVNQYPDLFEPLQAVPGSLDIDARTDFQLLLAGITGATFKFVDMHSNKRTIGSTSQFRGYLCACCLFQQYPTWLLGSFHQVSASWTQQRLQRHAICPLNRMKR